MKRLKGLYKDCDPIDQPPETYRDAMNININDQIGAIVTEKGTTSLFSIENAATEKFNPIGHTVLPDGRVALFYPDGIGVQDEDSFFVLAQP